jgi:hypothetical protein
MYCRKFVVVVNVVVTAATVDDEECKRHRIQTGREETREAGKPRR